MRLTVDLRAEIVAECMKLLGRPASDATIVRQWVGLRPYRAVGVKLDGIITTKRNHQVIVHNYGHGGGGHTMHWGCAREVLRLVLAGFQVRSALREPLKHPVLLEPGPVDPVVTAQPASKL